MKAPVRWEKRRDAVRGVGSEWALFEVGSRKKVATVYMTYRRRWVGYMPGAAETETGQFKTAKAARAAVERALGVEREGE